MYMTDTHTYAADVTPPTRRWMTREEAAAHLGVKERTIDRYRRAGLRAYQPTGSRVWRFRVEDLDAWMQPSGEAGDGQS